MDKNIRHPEAEKYDYVNIGSIAFIQDIIEAAKQHKPDYTPDDLVKAYDYYMEADCHYDFSQDIIMVTLTIFPTPN